MPARRRRGLWFAGILGVVAVAGVAAVLGTGGRRTEPVAPAQKVDESTPMSRLAELLRESDARALAVLFQRTAAEPETPPAPLTAAEAAEWVEAFGAMRTGFPRFGSYGRISALTVVGRVFERLAVGPAPRAWLPALKPAQDLLAAGLNDQHLDVRVTALVETGKLWSWSPGLPLLAAEENALADWKQAFHGPVVRRLGDPEPKSRAAAVACLGYLPIDAMAAPAVAYLDDPGSPEVRKQVLVSFARRAGLLTEDMVLKRMQDREAGNDKVAEMVLKTRGLNQEQISLGMMIFHPKPEIRASVIPMLKDRVDIDPAIWLLQLSRDGEKSVRLGAVDALSTRTDTPEVARRLAEMAATDTAVEVREAAGKLVAEDAKTAALPPLPGASGLNPTAN